MNNNTQKKEKRKYEIPACERIKLDNEIALVLASNPPAYNNESSFIPEQQPQNDIFKTMNA